MRIFLFLNSIGNLISALRLDACQRELVQGRFRYMDHLRATLGSNEVLNLIFKGFKLKPYEKP